MPFMPHSVWADIIIIIIIVQKRYKSPVAAVVEKKRKKQFLFSRLSFLYTRLIRNKWNDNMRRKSVVPRLIRTPLTFYSVVVDTGNKI